MRSASLLLQKILIVGLCLGRFFLVGTDAFVGRRGGCHFLGESDYTVRPGQSNGMPLLFHRVGVIFLLPSQFVKKVEHIFP